MSLRQRPDTLRTGRGTDSAAAQWLGGVRFPIQHDDVFDAERGSWLLQRVVAVGMASVIGVAGYVALTSPHFDTIGMGFFAGTIMGALVSGLLVLFLPREVVATSDDARVRHRRMHFIGAVALPCVLAGAPAVAILSGWSAGPAFFLSVGWGVATVGFGVYLRVAEHRLKKWTCPCCGRLRFAPNGDCLNCRPLLDIEDAPSAA